MLSASRRPFYSCHSIAGNVRHTGADPRGIGVVRLYWQYLSYYPVLSLLTGQMLPIRHIFQHAQSAIQRPGNADYDYNNQDYVKWLSSSCFMGIPAHT